MYFCSSRLFALFFFFNDTATTEIYTLSLHDALPISLAARAAAGARAHRQSPWRSRLSRQRRWARVRAGAVLSPQGGPAAIECEPFRPSLSDGAHCTGGRFGGYRSGGGRCDCRGSRAPRGGGAGAARHLLRPSRTAGPLHQLRAARAVPGRRARGRWRRRAGKRHRDRRARFSGLCALRGARPRAVRASQRRRRLAHRGALRGNLRVASPAAKANRFSAPGRSEDSVRRSARGRERRGLGRGLARRNFRRARGRPRRHGPALPSPRPVVAELARAGARGARKHRAGLSADQQVLQPVLLGRRPLMHKIVLRMVHAGIVTEPARAPDPALRALSQRLETLALERLGRALAVRHVDAGSCNGCELEIHALGNPYYNLEGLGIRFVASPRHADMLLVTGPVTKHTAIALQRTYDAMPEPKLVVAVGDCGCSGGIFGQTYASLGGVASVIPVDVAIPGCPPSPRALLQGILASIPAHGPPVAAPGDRPAVEPTL